MQCLAQGCSQPPRSSPIIGMAMRAAPVHMDARNSQLQRGPAHTVLGTVRSVVTYLNATRDAMQGRDPENFRTCIATQVAVLKNTIRHLNPDHADAANATNELRTSTCFNDADRNEVIDALNARMGQHTDIVTMRTARSTAATAQSCRFFFNYCTMVFWVRVMNLSVPFGDALDILVSMAIAIDLRNPKEGTIGVLLSTLFCARNQQYTVDAPFYYSQINILRGMFAAKRAALPPITYTIMQQYPEDPSQFIALYPHMYQGDDGGPVVPRVPVSNIQEHAFRMPTRNTHNSLIGTNFQSRVRRSGRSDCPTLALSTANGPALQDMMMRMMHACAQQSVSGNARIGGEADGNIRMLAPPQRAPTLPALGWDESQTSAGGYDAAAIALPPVAPAQLALAAGRASDASRGAPPPVHVGAETSPPPPPPHIPTHGAAAVEAAWTRAVHAAEAPAAAAGDVAAFDLAKATAAVDEMLARQRETVAKHRRLRCKTAVGQARVVAKAQNTDPRRLVADTTTGGGLATPPPKRARTSPTLTGMKDLPPPEYPGTDPHATIDYKGFSICNSISKHRWRVTTCCAPTYDKGFGYNTNPETVWEKVIGYCDSPTLPLVHWARLTDEHKAMFTVSPAGPPAPKVPSPAAIAPLGGHGKTRGKGKKRRK